MTDYADKPEDLRAVTDGQREGDWVVVAVMPVASGKLLGIGREAPSDQVAGLYKLMQGGHGVMQRYVTIEEAIIASAYYGPTRMWGGWALNLRTGETVPISPC